MSAAAYDALPVPLQHLAVALYGIKMRRVRFAGVFSRTREWLATTERASRDELRQIQSSELSRVLRHAASQTPYYSELFRTLKLAPEAIRSPEDLARLPLLEKQTLLARGPEFQAAGIGNVANYFTGGTTGTTLLIPIDAASRQRNYAFFSRALSWAGVEGARGATFAGRPVVPGDCPRPSVVWRWNPAMRNRLFSTYHLSPENARAYSTALCRYAPDYIDSYPSAVAILASLLAESRLPAPQVRAVITSSETLTSSQRDLIEQVFGARVYDQYGSTEQAAWITQCERGTYHVHPEYGIVEILRPTGDPARAGETGEIVCTSFTNDAFPLIRYRTGDLAIAGEHGCACGRHFPVVHQIVGRTDDVLVTLDGRRIGRLDPIFKGRRTIREAQVVQESRSRIIVRLVPAPGYAEQDGNAIKKELEARMGREMDIRIERVDAIERTRTGKFRAVVNLSRVTASESGDMTA
jgi:phenylacetate-CoA ligase